MATKITRKKSGLKELRKSLQRRVLNSKKTTQIEIHERLIKKAILNKNAKNISAEQKVLQKLYDKAAKTGVIPIKRADRIKSRLAKKIKGI